MPKGMGRMATCVLCQAKGNLNAMRLRPNGMQDRLPCGCYANQQESDCECEKSGTLDVWAVAGDDVNLNRQAETRAYRQSKSRR